MFLISSVCYLFSIFICIYFDFNINLFIFPLVLAIIILFLFAKKYTYIKELSILYCFLILGYSVSFFQHYSFDATLLNKTIMYKHMYATVYNIEKSYYYNTSKIYITDIQISGNKVKALVLPSYARMQYKGNTIINVGDVISFTGNLYPISKQLKPFGFNLYNAYFYNKIGATGFINKNIDIITNIKIENFTDKFFNQIDIFKDYLSNQIRSSLKNDRLATFLIAITLGSYTLPPHDDMINLQNSSLAHIISISGYHISLISIILFFCFKKILSFSTSFSLRFDNKKVAAFLTMTLIIAYSFIVGSNTPALRAVIADIMVCLAVILGFRVISLNTLFLAAVVLVSYNIYIIFSASFLLSFFATLAIILLMQSPLAYKKIQYLSQKKLWYKMIFIILFSMLLTAIVEITISPILAFYFSNVSLLGSLSNLVCEPVFSFIVMPFMILYYITPSFIAIYFLKIASYGMEFILYIAKITSASEYSIAFVPFYPDYIFTIILLSIVLFAVFYKYKIKYTFVTVMIIAQFYYLFAIKTPDIIISPNFSTIAFFRNNTVTYYKNPNKFLHSTWFGNKIQAISRKNDTLFNCIKDSCVTSLKDYKISISDTYEDLYEDCSNSDLILFIGYSHDFCAHSQIIDFTKIKNNYAFIYLDRNKPYIKYLKE